MFAPRPRSLRFKLNSAILVTFLAISSILAAILIPFGEKQLQSARQRAELLLSTAAFSQAERLANEMFEQRLEAVRLRLEFMIATSGLLGAGFYDADGVLLEKAGQGETGYLLPRGRMEELGLGDSHLVWEAGEAGTPVLRHLTRVGAMGGRLGYLLLSCSLSDVAQARSSYAAMFGGLLAVTLLALILFLNILLDGAIFRPLAELSRSMETMAGGGPVAPLRIGSTDEIGVLGARFNAMAERIQEHQASLVRAEEKYRGIFENAVEGIFQATPEGRLMSANPAMARILGHDSPAELLASGLDLSQGLLVRREERERLFRELRDQGQVVGLEVLMQRKDGGLVWGGVSLRGVPGPDGRPLRYEGSLMDINARKEKERAEKEREAAEAASREKSEFLARMSHDIRTPLNAILGMSDLLAEGPLTREQQGHVQALLSSGELLLNLINDILDFSRVEAGRISLEDIAFDVAELARDVCRLLSVRAREKGLEMHCSVAPGVPALVRGDPTRLRQVLINLMGNAVKFTPDGHVSLDVAPAPGFFTTPHMLGFTIQDTGIGIPAEQQETVFDSFAQADSSIARQFGGTGLGLAICRRLVELMGGRIGLQSVQGQGSTFTFTADLPRAEAGEGLPRPLAEPLASAGTGPATASRTLRILLVDDFSLNREVIRQFLKDGPMVVDEAEDGGQAADMAAAARYDLILLDLELPVMDGLETVRRIRAEEAEAHRPPCPVVALTGQAMDFRREQSLRAGCNAFLAKPVRKKDLLRVMAGLTGAELTGAGLTGAGRAKEAEA